ncbi:unnamed protein product [Psylliodes chrysocephalus]|uniref:Androgen-dependent TFPI-regulating protein n=1 Tax=Psylliodes chrysocephalus TaxID=3402493 RepID=A0A9P0CLR0_9CUCU|nr:unnamed protein product [Psylliodes chrysocephala]
MAVKRFVPLVLYSAIFLFYFFSLRSMKENSKAIRSDPEKSARMPQGYRNMKIYENRFFTGWTFMLQILFVTIASVDELTKLLGLPSVVKNLFGKTRAFLFNALLFPCTVLVIVTFWSIWHVDRELIFPKEIDEYFPSWLNHVLHSFIGIPILLELLLPKKDHFIAFKPAAVTLLLYCGIYQSLYFSIYFKDGVWLYPIYKVLDWPQRFIFNVIQVALILGFQYVGLAIQNSKNTKKSKQKVK